LGIVVVVDDVIDPFLNVVWCVIRDVEARIAVIAQSTVLIHISPLRASNPYRPLVGAILIIASYIAPIVVDESL